MFGWIVQMYEKVPARRITKLYVSPVSSASDEKCPFALLTVCGSLSRFSHTTRVPRLTTRRLAWNANFSMRTCAVLAFIGVACASVDGASNAAAHAAAVASLAMWGFMSLLRWVRGL